MTHLRNLSIPAEEKRIATKQSVTYAYVATAICGKVMPVQALTNSLADTPFYGELCPKCFAHR